jgi:hypothetical protein
MGWPLMSEPDHPVDIPQDDDTPDPTPDIDAGEPLFVGDDETVAADDDDEGGGEDGGDHGSPVG